MLINSRARKRVINSLAAPVRARPATMMSRQPWNSAAWASGTSSQLHSTRMTPAPRAMALTRRATRSTSRGLAKVTGPARSRLGLRLDESSGRRLLARLVDDAGHDADVAPGRVDHRLGVDAQEDARRRDRQQGRKLPAVQVADRAVALVRRLLDRAEE